MLYFISHTPNCSRSVDTKALTIQPRTRPNLTMTYNTTPCPAPLDQYTTSSNPNHCNKPYTAPCPISPKLPNINFSVSAPLPSCPQYICLLFHDYLQYRSVCRLCALNDDVSLFGPQTGLCIIDTKITVELSCIYSFCLKH